jgi:hypothetical protein
MPEALADLSPKVWQQRWVVHSAATGSGQNALRYLNPALGVPRTTGPP